MDKNIDAKRQDLLLIINEWMQQLDDKEQKDLEYNQVKPETHVLTVKELAAFLGVSTDSIYAMVREKQIPHFRVRRKILFHRTSIDDWCNKDVKK